MLETGQSAPAFTLKDTQGNTVKLTELKGKKVVLYFYPKDDTPGCTKEACDFRDNLAAVKAAGAVVLGVSPDDEASHQKFTAKFSLPFPLLCDVEHKIAEKYGAWGEKQNYGKTYMGIIRSTFLIDENGKLAQIWRNVKADGHVEKVLATLNA
ncbi:MAG: thioredoxin-dependent thiol peroxidase [Planctomycetota bacterium]